MTELFLQAYNDFLDTRRQYSITMHAKQKKLKQMNKTAEISLPVLGASPKKKVVVNQNKSFLTSLLNEVDKLEASTVAGIPIGIGLIVQIGSYLWKHRTDLRTIVEEEKKDVPLNKYNVLQFMSYYGSFFRDPAFPTYCQNATIDTLHTCFESFTDWFDKIRHNPKLSFAQTQKIALFSKESDLTDANHYFPKIGEVIEVLRQLNEFWNTNMWYLDKYPEFLQKGNENKDNIEKWAKPPKLFENVLWKETTLQDMQKQILDQFQLEAEQKTKFLRWNILEQFQPEEVQKLLLKLNIKSNNDITNALSFLTDLFNVAEYKEGNPIQEVGLKLTTCVAKTSNLEQELKAAKQENDNALQSLKTTVLSLDDSEVSINSIVSKIKALVAQNRELRAKIGSSPASNVQEQNLQREKYKNLELLFQSLIDIVPSSRSQNLTFENLVSTFEEWRTVLQDIRFKLNVSTFAQLPQRVQELTTSEQMIKQQFFENRMEDERKNENLTSQVQKLINTANKVPSLLQEIAECRSRIEQYNLLNEQLVQTQAINRTLYVQNEGLSTQLSISQNQLESQNLQNQDFREQVLELRKELSSKNQQFELAELKAQTELKDLKERVLEFEKSTDRMREESKKITSNVNSSLDQCNEAKMELEEELRKLKNTIDAQDKSKNHWRIMFNELEIKNEQLKTDYDTLRNTYKNDPRVQNVCDLYIKENQELQKELQECKNAKQDSEKRKAKAQKVSQ